MLENNGMKKSYDFFCLFLCPKDLCYILSGNFVVSQKGIKVFGSFSYYFLPFPLFYFVSFFLII